MGKDTDDLFWRDDIIFRNKELLEINHLPEEDKIVGRDHQINELAAVMNPAIIGQSPSNVLIFGKTGTGKSLTAKYVSERLTEAAAEEGVNAEYAYIDCSQDDTETQAVQSIGSTFNSDLTGIKIPDKGISTSTYYKRLWDILDQRLDVAIVVLDEIDKLENDDILMQLSRAGEAQKVSRTKIGVIGISNKINYKDRMDQRVTSSLGEREFVFSPYDANQLRTILEARKEAFSEGVLEDDVIPKIAAIAAQEHGDARKAIDMLRYAGEIAQVNAKDSVTVELVSEARNRAEKDRFKELIRGLTLHSRNALQALTILTLNFDEELVDDRGFRTTRIYDIYEKVCEQNANDPLSLRRVRDLLKEQAFLDITEQVRVSGGSKEGNHTRHRLLEDPETIRDVL